MRWTSCRVAYALVWCAGSSRLLSRHHRNARLHRADLFVSFSGTLEQRRSRLPSNSLARLPTSRTLLSCKDPTTAVRSERWR